MGLSIAHRLIHCGHDVIAWNRSSERLRLAEAEGISVNSALIPAIEAGEVLLLTLSDAAAIDEVLFSEQVIPLLEGKIIRN